MWGGWPIEQGGFLQEKNSLTLGQLSQIGSEVDRAESGFDLATRVIQMFREDIDSVVWCDLQSPSGGNSC